MEVLSIAEFSAAYGVGRTTTYREIAVGRLTAVKAGRRTLIRKDDAEKWLASLPRVSTSGPTGARSRLAGELDG